MVKKRLFNVTLANIAAQVLNISRDILKEFMKGKNLSNVTNAGKVLL